MSVLLLTGCAGGNSSAAGSGSQTPETTPASSENTPADGSGSQTPETTQAPAETAETTELEYTVNDMTEYIWVKQPAAEFRQVTWTQALRLFEEKGTGILLFGYGTCNYCQRAVPLLSEAAKQQNKPVYYIDVYAEPQPTEEEFKTMCTYIEETLDKDENGEPAFFVPAVIGIRNGEISGFHISLVDGFTPKDSSDQLTDEQKERLQNIYTEIIEKTY